MKNLADLIGRIFIAFIFLYEAYDSIRFFEPTKELMTYYGITWNQDFLLSTSIFILILGSLLVLVGYRAKFGAFLLLAYWIPATLIVHAFWEAPPELRREESISFMKNLAIIGGLLILLVNGSGRLSVKKLLATTKL